MLEKCPSYRFYWDISDKMKGKFGQECVKGAYILTGGGGGAKFEQLLLISLEK